jgi:magnesium transporter
MELTRMFRNGVLEDKDFPLADISEHLEIDGAIVWVDLCMPQAQDLQLVADELQLHALAVEDALDQHQRPKLDHYATHDFLSAYAARLDTQSGELGTSEISVFITKNALITVRKDQSFPMDGVIERWEGSADLIKFGIGGLLYGLLDFLVDGHFQTVQELDEQIELIEDLLFDTHQQSEDVQRRSFELRKSLVLLRRIVLPMREVVNTLMRRGDPVVCGELMPYYQDIYDHVLRATEWTESLRDLVASILETNLTIQSNELNVITKKITSWAAIIAVPTAITGFYGQNIPYPGFASHAGLIASSALIVVLSVSLYFVFKAKDWL